MDRVVSHKPDGTHHAPAMAGVVLSALSPAQLFGDGPQLGLLEIHLPAQLGD